MITRITLLSNVTGAGNGATAHVDFAGEYVCTVDGTFGGATVKLQQLSPDGASWLDILDASLTAEGSFIVALGSGRDVRAVLSGGAPVSMYCALDRVIS